jgi:hypothetical protein
VQPFARDICPRRSLTTNDQRPTTEKSYNSRVNSPVPPKPADDPHPDNKHRHHHATYAAEATGLLLMAVLLLILTITRYWRYIPWSAR